MTERIQDIQLAAEAIRRGDLVALPTETVYGLGGDGLNPEALAGIFAAKERPTFDPLILHVPRPGMISTLVANVPHAARRLVDNFWPGPLTIVLPKQPHVPDLATSGLGTVAVRCPDHPVMRQVLEAAKTPIAAPSANLFGRLSPTTPDHVMEQLQGRIPYVFEGGPCTLGLESTIVGFLEDGVYLLRPGALPTERIERMIGPLKRPVSSADGSRLPAPGLTARHYAPTVSLAILDDWDDVQGGDGVLWFGRGAQPASFEQAACVEVLSTAKDLKEAAKKFFPALHRLEAAKPSRIVARLFPDEGLGRALNDRLRRGSAL